MKSSNLQKYYKEKNIIILIGIVIGLVTIKITGIFYFQDQLTDPNANIFLLWEDLLFRGLLGPFAEELSYRFLLPFMITFGLVAIIVIGVFCIEIVRTLFNKNQLFNLNSVLNIVWIEILKFHKGIELAKLRDYKFSQVLIFFFFLWSNYIFAISHTNYGEPKVPLTFISGTVYIIAYYYRGILFSGLFHIINNSWEVLLINIDFISANSFSFHFFLLIGIVFFYSSAILIFNNEKTIVNHKWIFFLLPILVSIISFFFLIIDFICLLFLKELIRLHIWINSIFFFIYIMSILIILFNKYFPIKNDSF